MKTIEFECETHGRFEVDLEHGQEPPIWCPIYKTIGLPCGKLLKRVYSVPNVHFNGEGFTKTSRQG